MDVLVWWFIRFLKKITEIKAGVFFYLCRIDVIVYLIVIIGFINKIKLNSIILIILFLFFWFWFTFYISYITYFWFWFCCWCGCWWCCLFFTTLSICIQITPYFTCIVFWTCYYCISFIVKLTWKYLILMAL